MNTNRPHLKGLVWELLVGPLLEFNVYGGVKGARVHCLGSRQVNVLNHVCGNALPQLLLQYRLPGRDEDSTSEPKGTISLIFTSGFCVIDSKS